MLHLLALQCQQPGSLLQPCRLSSSHSCRSGAGVHLHGTLLHHQSWAILWPLPRRLAKGTNRSLECPGQR